MNFAFWHFWSSVQLEDPNIEIAAKQITCQNVCRYWTGYLQVLDGDLHAGQVHVGHPGAGALQPVADREGVGERLSHHRLVCGDGGHGGPVTLVGDEAGDAGHLVVRRYPDPAEDSRGEEGPEVAEEEHVGSPQESLHGRARCLVRGGGEQQRRGVSK